MAGRLETIERILPQPPSPSCTWKSLRSAPVLFRRASAQTYRDKETALDIQSVADQCMVDCARPVSKLTTRVTHPTGQQCLDWSIHCSMTIGMDVRPMSSGYKDFYTLSVSVFFSLTKPHCPSSLIEKVGSAQRLKAHGGNFRKRKQPEQRWEIRWLEFKERGENLKR